MCQVSACRVKRGDAIHQLFNKLQEELDAIGMTATSSIVDGLHHDFKDYEDTLNQGIAKLDERIPNEDLAVWIYG